MIVKYLVKHWYFLWLVTKQQVFSSHSFAMSWRQNQRSKRKSMQRFNSRLATYVHTSLPSLWSTEGDLFRVLSHQKIFISFNIWIWWWVKRCECIHPWFDSIVLHPSIISWVIIKFLKDSLSVYRSIRFITIRSIGLIPRNSSRKGSLQINDRHSQWNHVLDQILTGREGETTSNGLSSIWRWTTVRSPPARQRENSRF